ncbi:MAG: universal stress protein [Syntrophomonadaceae bacterium]|jgi:nucleotide-binding universal stress UspA family protein
MRYKKILLATDGSEHSLEAAKRAKILLDQGAAEELVIMNVIASMENHWDPTTLNMVKEQADNLGRQVIESTQEIFGGNDKISTVVEVGPPAETICKYAAKNGVDLIVIGSRGLNTFSGLLLGSVSHRVIHYANCPVLLVKPYREVSYFDSPEVVSGIV